MGQHKDSKKRRYMALFVAAKARLEVGEVVFIGLEATDPLEVFASENTVRLYWGHWRKAQLFLDPAANGFLKEVQLRLRQLNGQHVVQLARKDTMLEAVLDGKRPWSTLLLTGHGGSTLQTVAGKDEQRLVSKENQKLIDLSEENKNADVWLKWTVDQKLDMTQHWDQFKVPFNSPEAVAYRATHGGD